MPRHERKNTYIKSVKTHFRSGRDARGIRKCTQTRLFPHTVVERHACPECGNDQKREITHLRRGLSECNRCHTAYLVPECRND